MGLKGALAKIRIDDVDLSCYLGSLSQLDQAIVLAAQDRFVVAAFDVDADGVARAVYGIGMERIKHMLTFFQSLYKIRLCMQFIVPRAIALEARAAIGGDYAFLCNELALPGIGICNRQLSTHA